MFEIVPDKYRKHPDAKISIPKRSTEMSAGYDFYMPCDVKIWPGQTITVLSDICVKLPQNTFLMCVVRSSIGIKKHLRLQNSVGIVDADFYGNENNFGNISIGLHNYGSEAVELKMGEKVIQGIIMQYNFFESEIKPIEKRKSGIGSTGK